MLIEWDERKRQDILEKRGVDILDAALIFEGPVLSAIDDRSDYGEERFRSLGEVDGTVYMVVHTRRGDSIRLITAWTVGRRDRERYEKSLAARALGNERERRDSAPCPEGEVGSQPS